MSKLNHPNCVSVVDFGVWEGAPYLVMDFVAGIDAARADRQGPDAAAAARSRSRARSLSASRTRTRRSIVHRDIKPANIMISEEIGHGEHVRILDFGLARLRGNVGRDATQTNIVVGTPNYMAPEQTVPGGDDRRAHRHLRGRRRAVRDDRRRSAVPRRGHAAAARHASRRADPAARRSRRRGHRAAERPAGADRQGDGEVARRAVPDRDRARRGDRRRDRRRRDAIGDRRHAAEVAARRRSRDRDARSRRRCSTSTTSTTIDDVARTASRQLAGARCSLADAPRRRRRGDGRLPDQAQRERRRSRRR